MRGRLPEGTGYLLLDLYEYRLCGWWRHQPRSQIPLHQTTALVTVFSHFSPHFRFVGLRPSAATC